MEKIININFQGRIIPIEETAYNSLKQYTDGLRRHFASEEGRDEIINDIENRIAELLTYRLKQGASCITIADLNAVINSIGRVEDIEAADAEEVQSAQGSRPQQPQPDEPNVLKGRFYRNADDKVIAGVCSGIANRVGIDPVVMRVLFVLLFGALFWIYLLLWIIVPSQSVRTNVTRRLYRNPDNKMIAGVCSGLAAYFKVDVWIPRLVFALPLALGIFSRSIYHRWWHLPMWGLGPRIFVGGFGSTMLILYVVLWIALPYATSATDKMEMRGEKIDLNSIKAASQANAGAPASRQPRSGLGRVIGILFKAFFLLIAGSIALSLFGVLIGLGFTSFVAIPFTSFVMDSWAESVIAWCGIVLSLGIPLLALVTWMVRRLMSTRSHRHYLGYVFAGLWVIGIVCCIISFGSLIRDFSNRAAVDETFSLAQPSNGKLHVEVGNDNGLMKSYHSRWISDYNYNGKPFNIINKDSIWLNTVKVRVAQSPDSLFHVYETKISRGETPADARSLASHISFTLSQQDSIVTLPAGFAVSSKDKFRNQQVLITVEAPQGKEVQVSDRVDEYDWFSINIDERNFNVEHNVNGRYRRYWRHRHFDESDGGRFIITPDGPKLVEDTTKDKDDDDDE